VTASTITSVTTTVPAGASGTGPISVTVGCHTATSSTDFTVICSPVPTITSFSPASGPAGTSVTITGTNFSTTPADNLVDFNGVSAIVTASTSTSITAEVPEGATLGPISIDLDCHHITSTTDFDVIAIITITTHPADIAVCEDAIATFSAAATGADNITYQWQYSADGIAPFADIVNGGAYADATTAMLSVNTSGAIGAGRYRCSISGDLATSVVTDEKELSVSARPSAPGGSSASLCGSGSVTLEATGGFDGQYKWYTVPLNGTAIDGEVNSTYTTPALSVTTVYYATIVNGECESPRTPVTATITISSSSPATSGASVCPGSTATLTASGGTNGQYKWYSEETSGTAFPDEVNDSYTTPELASTTTYYVTVTDNGCESLRAPVTATILTSGCAPEITNTTLATEPGGKIVIDLKPLITTTGILDVNSIQVTTAPLSGALITMENGVLTIDYTSTLFSGTEFLTIEACNTNGICAQQDFSIEVVGDIVVYNAISPNGDDKNSIFRLEFIDLLPATKTNTVSIYNRWGDEVFSVTDYDNKTRVFAGLTSDGSKLPSGIYFYKIVLPLQEKTMTGFLELRY
jgi:gliding motility-associated-like protein